MRFIIDRDILLESLSNVMRAISPKNTIPILNGVRFDLTEEGLTLTASDGDLIIRNFIGKNKIQILNVGKTVVQNKSLLEILRLVNSGNLTIEVKDDVKLNIKTKSSEHNLYCLNVFDYPEISFELTDNPIKLKSNLFKEVIKQTSFALSIQESRPLLTGMHLLINQNKLECMASDSYRLAKKTINLDSDYGNYSLIIPGRNVNEIERILGTDGIVSIHLFFNKLIFVYENYILQTSLLNGVYPINNNIIPTDFKHVISLSRDSFENGIAQASVFTQVKERSIVKLKAENDNLIITSAAVDQGDSKIDIIIQKNIPDEIVFSCSSRFLLDALRTFKDDELLILVEDFTKPVILKSSNDESLVQLIIPIMTY